MWYFKHALLPGKFATVTGLKDIVDRKICNTNKGLFGYFDKCPFGVGFVVVVITLFRCVDFFFFLFHRGQATYQ